MRRLAPRRKPNRLYRPFPAFSSIPHVFCGDDRDRTGNLRLAKPALSQLSYVPERGASYERRGVSNARCNSSSPLASLPRPSVLGVLGFEPRTSALSELRSSQLSYTPVPSRKRRRQIKKPNRLGFGSTRIEFRIERQPVPIMFAIRSIMKYVPRTVYENAPSVRGIIMGEQNKSTATGAFFAF